MPGDRLTRRDVLKATGAAIGAAALSAVASAQISSTSRPPKAEPFIGIQGGPMPLMVGDIDRFLADLHDRAAVNAIFPFVYTYAASTAAMNPATFHGGNFCVPHMQYYKQTTLKFDDMRAPDFGDTDLLARAIPAARRHGMKIFAWIIEDHSKMPSRAWEEFYEIDFHGRRARAHPAGPCFNNPLYRAFVLGLVEDYVRSYDIDGIMWGSERQGGFFNALGAYAHGSGADPGQATCFCEYCQARAAKMGIDVDRARKGFAALESFVRDGRAARRPRDGYFVTFFRLMLNYPELLAWENLWEQSREQLQQDMFKLVKSIKPSALVGWHIWHNVSLSPLHRAEIDFTRLASFSDFLKPVLYNNCAGERIHAFTSGFAQNVLGDFPASQALEVLYRMLNYQEAGYDRVTATGWSADYVLRETSRALQDVAGTSVQVWPGIDIDVPVPQGASLCTADGIKKAVIAAFNAGAPGVLLSRNWSEMNPEHLSAAGGALDELGLR
jgi:hypothetical protein